MNQTKVRAQEFFNQIITMNSYFNEEIIYVHSTMILLPGKKLMDTCYIKKYYMNGFGKKIHI